MSSERRGAKSRDAERHERSATGLPPSLVVRLVGNGGSGRSSATALIERGNDGGGTGSNGEFSAFELADSEKVVLRASAVMDWMLATRADRS